LKPDSRERLCSSVVFPKSNTMKLYVGNLTFETTENDLQDLFEQHGAVNEVNLMMDRMTGKSRGFAFVTMNDDAQANAAMSALNGRELNGRPLTVNEARPRADRPRPSGGKRSFSGFRR
jgi:cold-inducible RNA-binding protein